MTLLEFVGICCLMAAVFGLSMWIFINFSKFLEDRFGDFIDRITTFLSNPWVSLMATLCLGAFGILLIVW